MVTVETGSGLCGNTRQVQVGVLTGQTGIDQCGNSRDWYRSKWYSRDMFRSMITVDMHRSGLTGHTFTGQ